MPRPRLVHTRSDTRGEAGGVHKEPSHALSVEPDEAIPRMDKLRRSAEADETTRDVQSGG